MPKKYQFLLYPFLLNSVLLPELKADKPLVSPKLIEVLKQYSPKDLKNGIELRPGGDEMQKALWDGDAFYMQKVEHQENRANIVKKFAEIEELRITGNFEEANKQLQICHNTSFQKPDVSNPLPPVSGVAMTCNQLAAGNDFLEGNLAAWGIKLDVINTVYYPAIRQHTGLEEFSLAAGKMGRLTVLSNTIPPFTITGIDQQQTIALQFPSSVESPQILKKYSGSKMPYIMSSFAPFFLATDTAIGKLPKGLINSPHVRIVGHIEDAVNGSSEHYSGDLGIVDEIRIGKAILRNVPFLFTDTNPPVLGLMILQKLGKVKIDKQAITFGKDINCDCQKDIHFGSSAGGNYQALKYPLEWKDKTISAVVNLNQDNVFFDLLTFKENFTSEEEKKSSNFSQKNKKEIANKNSYFEEGYLLIDGINYGKRRKLIVKEVERTPDTIIGMSILDKASLYLDFINHKACLKPNNSDATPIPQ
ncbi:hypothetical protein [Zymomonas mobilis]|uniref:hypothetical protein n=1 Tax=Zymomonas mobilis TaxID=542 RepID=UPI0003C76C14|nr:hypothetical protein [Zymomonas mobilis]AHB10284.1 hypothetical protein ZCP4_0985 [Zymomonas mobilis subsp. mobilis str. CP4 = NRRL B-14023]AHJ70591.1 hypothetical protein A254_00977 [Zymomonas mobilis subsp. mobilis NRRL B-12526]AHJ72445.1 hypothetical protein A265_00978 [Zymomonas mobilis subsp. mobilis str. CP4 = NRRL B-14023]TWE26725.1 hypothetical protein FBY52_101186 [Zymomonas mobilis]